MGVGGSLGFRILFLFCEILFRVGMVADAQDFIEGGNPFACFQHAVFEQVFHSCGTRGAAQILRWGSFECHFADFVIHAQEFIDPLAAAEACVVAVGAASTFHECGCFELFLGDTCGDDFLVWWVVWDLALGADNSDQALGHDRDDRAGHEEGLDADIHKTGDGRGGIVGVEGRKNQVSRKGCLDGDFGGFVVADFPNKDDVRGLPEHRADDSGEVQADVVAHFALVDAGEVVLDGIFGGDDLFVGAVLLVERGVEGRGFAGTGGAGHQKDAVGTLDDVLEALIVIFGEAKVADIDRDVPTVEYAHDAGLPLNGGEHRDAHVIGFAIDDGLDTTVLAAAFFCDVDVSHDFETGKDGSQHTPGRVVALDEDTVDAVADSDTVGKRLDMDIRGAETDSFGNNKIYQFNNWGIRFLSLSSCAGGFRFREVDGGVSKLGEHRVDRFGFGLPVVAVDRLDDLFLGSKDGNNVFVEDELEFCDRVEIGRVGHGNLEVVPLDGEWENQVFAGDGFGDQFDNCLGNCLVGEVDELEIGVFRDRLHCLFGGAVTELYEHLVEFGAGLRLHGSGFFELVRAEDGVTDEKVSEIAASLGHGLNVPGGPNGVETAGKPPMGWEESPFGSMADRRSKARSGCRFLAI